MIAIQQNIFGGGEGADIQSKLKLRPAPHSDAPITVSFGGGTNSSALLIALTLKEIKADAIIFADTGAELPETYEWVRAFGKWLEAKGQPEILWAEGRESLAADGRKYKTLEEKCLVTESLPSKAYGRSSCSVRHKKEPIEKSLRALFPDARQIRQLIGYHAGETHRLAKIKSLTQGIFYFEYPLVEWGMGQQDCLRLIQAVGLTPPPKSSCFFCPNRKMAEILALREKHPELFARAVALEENSKEKNRSVKGWGRTWAWGDLEKMSPLEQALAELRQESFGCACFAEEE